MKTIPAIIVMLALALLGNALSAVAQNQKSAPAFARAPQAVLLFDDFESYATFPAGNWVNNNSNSVWTIEQEVSKIVRQSAAQTSIVSNGNAAWTDYAVSALVRSNALGVRSGLLARYTNSSSYYSLYLRSTASGGTKVLELNKRVGGTNVVLQTVSVPLAAGVFYKLTLEVSGGNIKGFYNDELKIQATDTDYASGKAGFYNTGDSSYDDFSVSDLSDPPSAPTGLSASAANGQIDLSWTGAAGATGYTVKRGTTSGGPFEKIASVTTNAHTDTNLTIGTTYFYVVSANNSNGESANSNEASATAQMSVPSAPGGLHTASGNGEAKIYWTVSANAASYKVKRSLTSGGTFTTIAENVTATEYKDTNLTNGTVYYYRISAVNAAGESTNSSSVSAAPRLGQIVNVSSQSGLQSALNNAVAGDQIILADGNYSAFKVRRKYGTAENPIVVRSQNPRGAVFRAGQLELENTLYITFEGFRWTLSAGIKLRGAQFNRLTRNLFQFNETNLTDLDWLSVGGASSHHNRIDHNDFRDKITLGNFITLGGENGQVSQYDLIDHNYFFNLGPRAANEKEAVRLGDSGVSRSSGFTVLEHNLFERCDGDPEIVSVKTNDNIVRYNTFRRSQGGLTARQGNRSLLYGNFFIGENAEGTGGIRAYGDDHKIFNNYFEGLTGTANYAPIAITNGDADGADLPGADQSKHYRPQRILIANNTLVGNASNIEIGGAYNLPPRDITFANNIIVGSTGALVKYRTAPINPVYAGNIAYPTGTATIGIAATEAEIRNTDPLLVAENGVQKLGSGSPAIDASAVNYAFVSEDFEGQTRDAQRDAGADEFGAFTPQRLPLTAKNAGLNSANFSVSGRVVNAVGSGIGGVKIALANNASPNLTGTTEAATETDAGGYFFITDLAPNENYTLTLSKTDYSFDPASIGVSDLSADLNLAAIGTFLVPTAASVRIAGRVFEGASAVGVATVVLTNQAGENFVTKTNGFGNFSFGAVPAGQTYVLTARAKGLEFASQIVSVNEELIDLAISALP